MKKENLMPLQSYIEFPTEEMKKRSQEFYKLLKRRRTIREFSSRSVPKEIIENCILAANTAPSGANMQPWHFVAVSDKKVKRKIRVEAEKEEKEFYNGRAPKEWLDTLKQFETNDHKPFLEEAPYLIVIFEQKYGIDSRGKNVKHYYANESTGLAAGFLISAIHNAGLVSLTHTPSPMSFLNEILNRPKNEKPFLILVVGYPAKDAKVPNVKKKKLEEVATFI